MNPETERKRRRVLGLLQCKGRRLLALVLCLTICLGVLPTAALRAMADDDTSPADSTTPASTERSVSVSSSDEKTAGDGVDMTNTYILEVSNGTVRGGGTADNVKYFVIYYTTGTGRAARTRSAVIFPGKDGMRKGMETAHRWGNRDDRRERVGVFFGYTTTLEDRKGLGSVHTDQYLFTTPDKIETIDRIQIFGRVEETTGSDGKPKIASTSWACQGMRIHRVDHLYGLDMYGWFSDDGYIDYRGEIIADVVMSGGGGIFHWNNSAGVFNITTTGGTAGVVLVNTQTAASSGKANFVGTQHDSQVNNRLVFQIDLADVAGGGFESLAGSYEAGAESKISSLKFCETAALRFYYRDIYDCIREVKIPVIVNALGWTMEKLDREGDLGDVAIAGYAQQGDSIALSLMLPDFKELTSVEDPNGLTQAVELSVGESMAAAKAGLKPYSNADQSIRPTRVATANQENVSYLCVAAYRDVTVNIQHDSATLRYSFTPGEKEPGASIVAGSTLGVDLDAGSVSVLPMVNYRENMKLHPRDNREYYLVTISTDNVVNAGTATDISIQFRYLNYRDKEVKSPELKVRDYVDQFYGEWPGNTENFAYKYGFRTSGTIQMLIPLNDVKQFRTVSVKVNGADEWQFKGIHVARAMSWSPRIARWKEIDKEWTSSQRLKSHLIITREVDAMSPCFKCGSIYDEDHPDVNPKDPSWKPGNLVQDDDKYHEFDGESKEVATEEAFDWSDYRYYMTYEDTLQELGFNKERCLYQVTVKVAGDKVAADDDDCGSANLFYFQLIFEDGKSGCVLANQQLQADAFRTGADAQFTIPTTQDYGDLTAIRIIPDDQDSNSDIYDKLKIDYIKVKKQSTGKISPTWTADSVEGLGWVGIDYRDPGAAGSNRGVDGRSISQVAHTFEITKTSYSAKLLISISTGSYKVTPVTNAYGETFTVTDPVLATGMTMSYHYYDHNNQTKTVDPFDIIALMNDYSGLEDNKTRTVDGITETMDFCVSNPDYQFRPGTQDKFYIDVDDITQIVDMQLQIRSSVQTHWTINNVSVYLVQGPGSRYINGNGEYDFKYPEGQGLSLRCTWNRPQTLTKYIPIYSPPDPTSTNPEHQIIGSSITTIDIGFNENSFPLGEDDWVSTVTKEPRSKDDTLNLFLYPSTESGSTDPEDYSLISEVLYTDTLHQNALRINTGKMELTYGSDGEPVFYALGLSANYFEAFSGVEIKTDSVRPANVPISYGVLQRVRDGVLIDSYYLIGGGNADLGITMKPMLNPAGQNIQRFFLQVDQETEKQQLIAEEKDLAVALYFKTGGPNDRELRTKYIYLTDQGFTTVQPGEVLELVFALDDVVEITGVNLVCMGRLNIGFDYGEILEQNADGVMRNKWSISSSMAPTRTPARFEINGTVGLLDVDLKTALSDNVINSSTSGPVRMTVGYFDYTGNLMTETYEDIRDHTTANKPFQAGNSDLVRVLIPDLVELRWIELEPLSSDPSAEVGATWKLESMSVLLDLSEYNITRVLNQLILENEPLRISLADILLAGTVSIVLDPEDEGNPAGDYAIPTGGYLDLALNAGEGVRVVPKMVGSRDGVDIKLNRLDPVTGALGRADLVDTRGYTQEQIDEWRQQAEENGNYAEAEVWASVVPDDGTWEIAESYYEHTLTTYTEYVQFLPPHNYTNETIYYRLTLTSKENPDVSVWLNVSVPTETNPVDQLIEEARMNDQSQRSTQRVLLQTTLDTPDQVLLAGQTDMTVALTFIPTGGSNEEKTSHTINLSEQGIQSIGPGRMLEVDFRIANVQEITGIEFTGVGNIIVSFEHAVIFEQSETGAITRKWSFEGRKNVSTEPTLFMERGNVCLVEIELDTAVNDEAVAAGTNGPIRMRLCYNQPDGNQNTRTFEDLRRYLESDRAFAAGSKDKVRLLIPDVSELRWVDLEPLSPDGYAIGTWKIESLRAEIDFSGYVITRTINQLIRQNEPLKISLADILLTGLVSSVTDDVDPGNPDGDYTVITGSTLDLVMNLGEGVRIVPRVDGSTEGLDVVLYRVDPATGALGRAELADTRGYTVELLDAYAQAALENGNLEEAAVWYSVWPDSGIWDVYEVESEEDGSHETRFILFIPPHNYTDAVMYYRIIATSRENPAVSFTINLSVQTEKNPVEELLEEARAKDEDARDHVHVLTFIAAVAATCVSSGQKESYFCQNCGKYFLDPNGETEVSLTDLAVQPTGIHSYGPSTSTGYGMHTHTCTVCLQSETVECTYGSCTSNYDGTHTHSCTECGYSEDVNCVFGNWTPNGDGSHTHTCAECGWSETTGCSYGSWTSNGDGSHTHSCNDCGWTETDACSFLGWKPNDDGTHTRYCSECSYSESGSCSFGSWTSNNNGTHFHSCGICSYLETEDCSYVDVVTPPTETEQGYTTHTCTECGYTFIDDFTAPIGDIDVPPDTSEPEGPGETEEPSDTSPEP